MAAIGGSSSNMSVSGRTFSITFDADLSVDYGGFTNEREPNGDGSTRPIKSRKGWMIEGIVVSIDPAIGDQLFLQDLADGNDDFACRVALPGGEIVEGTGNLQGDMKKSTQSASMPIVLSGGGKLTSRFS